MATHESKHARRPSPRDAGTGAQPASAASTPAASGAAPAERPPISDESTISTIGAGQGARVTTRANASEAADRARQNARARYQRRHPEATEAQLGPERSTRNLAAVVVGALLALALVALLARCTIGLLTSDSTSESSSDDTAATATDSDAADESADDATTVAATDQVDASSSLSYGDYTYSLAQTDDGTYAVVRTDASGSSSTLFELDGTPVALVRYGDIILVPQNVDDGWNVMCCSLASTGVVAGYVVDSTGEAAGGTSSIASVSIDGDTLYVTDTAGTTTAVALD